MRILRLRRRRSRVPGMYLIYHADPGKAGAGPGAALAAPKAMVVQQCAAGIGCESALALPAEECGHVERRGRLELRAGPHVVRCGNR